MRDLKLDQDEVLSWKIKDFQRQIEELLRDGEEVDTLIEELLYFKTRLPKCPNCGRTTYKESSIWTCGRHAFTYRPIMDRNDI